jgi:RNA polymerase sigma-70 factor (ECF subfamily)
VSVDAAPVRRAQRGDPRALDQVVAEFMPYVSRICGAIALEDGDDAPQEAMIVIVKNLASLREPGALHGWARRIAVREAVRTVRGGKAVPMDPAVFTTPPYVASEATSMEVHDILAALPPEQRAVLVLRHLDGIGEDEMTDVLGVATGTVKSRLHRARQAFRARWVS